MRNNKIARLFSGLLALLMLMTAVAVFASCDSGDDHDHETESSSTGGESTTDGDDGEEDIKPYDALTKTKYDRNLVIATISNISVDMSVDFVPNENNKGETLTDALITRNIRLKSDYGVELVPKNVGDYYAISRLMNEQQAGKLDDYDLYAGQLHNFVDSALQNQCVDYNSMANINLNGGWWDRSCKETLLIDGKNFMMTGDISPESMLISACMVFNKNMMQDLKKDEPYDLVKAKKWTLDTLYEYIGDVTNEDAQDGRGRYGLTCWCWDAPYSLFYGCNLKYVKFDAATGNPEISYDANKAVSIYDKIYKVVVTAKSYYLTYEKADKDLLDQQVYQVFADGRALFSDITLRNINRYITSMEDDYGVVPMPKYDEAQAEYLTFVNGGAPLCYVSTTEKDVDFVSDMMEAMATYNYSYITNSLYEIIVKSKDARDPQTPEMVDIILRSRVYDFAYYADLSISKVVSQNLAVGRESVASQYKAAKNSSEKSLKLILKNWQNIMSKA